ncbi:MAG: bifunctional phosphopantothenoylcysteine decarboxylase/phosphopantothenate--cysteine ligase CoaBC [Euryarchaeota archaeon]|nr:bifunctional phosphopantothenoylcysteine decarboxylase/phosphopantothenate--cysteine ligase CoaBC [Euryarchaeota archaeon]
MPRDVDVVLKSRALEGRKVLLGISGGIAAVETVRLARELRRHGAEIHVIMTRAATEVISPLAVRWATQANVDVEWDGDMSQLDGYDGLLIAPATRNTLAKHVNGVMDSPLAMAMAAAAGNGTPTMVVPSMHNDLFDDAVTQDLINSVIARGAKVLVSESEEGRRKQPDPVNIVAEFAHYLNRSPHHRNVLVLLGGTESSIDDVRVITNRSTGQTGFGICDGLHRLGHQVTILAGRTSLDIDDSRFKIVYSPDVGSMKCWAKDLIENDEIGIDAVISAAAISDHVVDEPFSGKISSDDVLGLRLSPFPKIIDGIVTWLGKNRGVGAGPVIGFKLLSNSNEKELVQAARSQIERSGVSAVVANDLSWIEGDGRRALWVTMDEVSELANLESIVVAIDRLLLAQD